MTGRGRAELILWRHSRLLPRPANTSSNQIAAERHRIGVAIQPLFEIEKAISYPRSQQNDPVPFALRRGAGGREIILSAVPLK